MALDRTAIRTFEGVAFSKLLGCGKGIRFTPRDADPHRWGLLVCIEEDVLQSFDQSPLIQRWRKKSKSEFRMVLLPISSHGHWSKRQPFDYKCDLPPSEKGIVAITRARIAWRQTFRFWQAVPPVVESLRSSPGLIYAFGIGEAPIGLQGTFSLWESESALQQFAFKSEAHRSVITESMSQHWFSEELFARFSVKETRGSL